MASKQALHAVVASNGACRRRPVILSTVTRTHSNEDRPVKLVREFDPIRNPKTRRV
ncbi:MAG: hypothetical protein O3B74_03565 [Proteobacteria bacterium]|nr:hypothetical protein [Pseudomonadota bacterium]MDA1309706.1 hypothetical protein [Pseudomonadota bacterium]